MNLEQGIAVFAIGGLLSSDLPRVAPPALVDAWSYLTDYEADLMTTIIFHNGVVAETKQSKWLPYEKSEAERPGV